MTEPLRAAAGPGGRPGVIRTPGAADRLRGRWPATDRLTRPAARQPPTDPAGSTLAAAAELAERQDPPAPAADIQAVGDIGRPDPAPEQPASFADRMAVINAHFTNLSTGETSVDHPLVTIDAHHLNYETDTHAQRQRPSALRPR